MSESSLHIYIPYFLFQLPSPSYNFLLPLFLSSIFLFVSPPPPCTCTHSFTIFSFLPSSFLPPFLSPFFLPFIPPRYWHRSLNPKKLVEVQFSSLHRNMTLQRMIRLYRLPEVANLLSILSSTCMYSKPNLPAILRIIKTCFLSGAKDSRHQTY